MQPKILSENTEFLQFAKNKWETTQSKQTKVKPAALNYAKNYWKTILDRHLDYPQFYKAVNLLPLNYNEDELAVTVALVQNLLEMVVTIFNKSPSASIKSIFLGDYGKICYT